MSEKRFMILAMFVAVTALIAGAAAGRIFRPQKAGAQDDIVFADELGVLDEDGNLRVLVSATGDAPAPAVYLYGQDGTSMASCGLSDADEPMIVMNNDEGEMRIVLGVMNEGGPGILIKKKDGSGTAFRVPPLK